MSLRSRILMRAATACMTLSSRAQQVADTHYYDEFHHAVRGHATKLIVSKYQRDTHASKARAYSLRAVQYVKCI